MVTDTTFRNSRLGKLILEKTIPGTSKNWPYYTDFLVFCVKLKFSSVCDYLNYYYNITNDCWAIPEKPKQKIEDISFKKSPSIFEVCYFTLGNSRQNKAFFTLGNSPKLRYTPWKFQRQKLRLMKMHYDFFLITPKNSTFKLGNSGQMKALLLQIL